MNPTITLELTHQEAMALWLMAMHAPNKDADETATVYKKIEAEAAVSLYKKILRLADQLRAQDSTVYSPPTQKPTGAALPAAAQPTSGPRQSEMRVRWAKDRQGNATAPDGYQTHNATIWALEQKPKYLKVTWQGGREGYVSANCFDADLWNLIGGAKESGRRYDLYTVKSKDGKYLNLVGIRA